MAAGATATALGEMVAIGVLFPSPLNPRKKFTAESLADLQANIQKRGEVIVPLILRTKGAKHEIVDGERRYRAAKGAGNIQELPAIFRNDLTDGEVIEIQLLSAIQRQELTPLEEAAGYKALIDSNPSRYSAAYIADRIGHSEKYVWDTMKLLDLVPEVRDLLEREVILVGHARLICKLKPADQKDLIKLPSGYSSRGGGLFEGRGAVLKLDDDKDDKYRHYKPITVRELEAYITRHVRFDVKHAAEASPLDFGPLAEQVKEAEARPGRRTHVVALTSDHHVHDDAKDKDQRTYGRESWRAVGKRMCDKSVLGVFVSGDRQGESLEVCVNRDCEVHFAKEKKEREKNAKLRAQGKGSQAAQREQRSVARQQEQWRKEEQARELKRKVWKALYEPLIQEGVRQAKAVKKLTARHATVLEKLECEVDGRWLKSCLGAQWFKLPAAPIVLVSVFHSVHDHWGEFGEFVKNYVKPLGFDVKAFEKVRDEHMPKSPDKAGEKAEKR